MPLDALIQIFIGTKRCADFFQKSPQSFCFVCDLAELDPDAVRDHFFKALMTKNIQHL